MSRLCKRLRQIELAQRPAVRSVEEMTDDELLRIIATALPDLADTAKLTDEELERIASKAQ